MGISYSLHSPADLCSRQASEAGGLRPATLSLATPPEPTPASRSDGERAAPIEVSHPHITDATIAPVIHALHRGGIALAAMLDDSALSSAFDGCAHQRTSTQEENPQRRLCAAHKRASTSTVNDSSSLPPFQVRMTM